MPSLPPCAKCGEPAESKCSRCHSVVYCGTACQSAHWTSHRTICAASVPVVSEATLLARLDALRTASPRTRLAAEVAVASSVNVQRCLRWPRGMITSSKMFSKGKHCVVYTMSVNKAYPAEFLQRADLCAPTRALAVYALHAETEMVTRLNNLSRATASHGTDSSESRLPAWFVAAALHVARLAGDDAAWEAAAAADGGPPAVVANALAVAAGVTSAQLPALLKRMRAMTVTCAGEVLFVVTCDAMHRKDKNTMMMLRELRVPFLAGIAAVVTASTTEEPLVSGPAMCHLSLLYHLGLVSPHSDIVGAAVAVYFRLLARSTPKTALGDGGGLGDGGDHSESEFITLLEKVADCVRPPSSSQTSSASAVQSRNDFLRGLRDAGGATALDAAIASLHEPAASKLRGLQEYLQ